MLLWSDGSGCPLDSGPQTLNQTTVGSDIQNWCHKKWLIISLLSDALHAVWTLGHSGVVATGG